jgi:hypothetical protein
MGTANGKHSEWIWKIFIVVLGVLIVPLGGWVWNTNVVVTQLQNDLGDAEEVIVVLEQKVEEAEENSRAIISIEKDIEYMRSALERIERLVAE